MASSASLSSSSGSSGSSSIGYKGSIIDILLGQPIKLIQAASNSELRENQWNDLLFFEIVPSQCFGASEASKIVCFKNGIKYGIFGRKILIPLRKMDILVP